MGELELSRAIRMSEATYRDRAKFDTESVFWNIAYSVGIIGLGYVAIKAGVMIADTQLFVNDSVRKLELSKVNTDIKSLESAIAAKSPTFAALPTWLLAVSPFSGLVTKIWDFLRVAADDPGLDAELSDMAYDLEALYLKRIELMAPAQASESAATGFVRQADAYYGRYGPILPLGVVGGNVLIEAIRVRRLKKEVEG